MTRKANRNFKRFNTMNTRRQTLLLWLATWCMPLLMNATDTSWKFRITNIGNTPHSHVTFKDNRVNSLYKDSNGFLWIGTGSTVERLNGLHTTVYTFTGGEPAGSSPSPYLVNDIQERATKEFWVATNRGLWKLDHKENIAERQFAETINLPVYSLANDEENNLYIGTSNGLYINHPEQQELSHILPEERTITSEFNQVLDIHVTSPREVWLLTPQGLVKCDATSQSTKRITTNETTSHLTCLDTKNRNELYIGTTDGKVWLYHTTNDTWSLLYKHTKSTPITDLSYENGFLAIATRGGGIALADCTSGHTHYTCTYHPMPDKGLLADNISSILLSDGNIWCGNDFYLGLNLLLRENTFATPTFLSDDRLKELVTRSFLRTDTHTLIGCREGFYIVNHRTGEIMRQIQTTSKGFLRSNLIFSMHETDNGILIGTCGGGMALYHPQSNTFSSNLLTEKMTNNDIFMFLEDEETSTLWIATSDGLYAYNPKETPHLQEYGCQNADLPSNMVFGIFIDSHKRFWLATDKGVALFDLQKRKCHQTGIPQALRTTAMRQIAEGSDGTLCFCTLDYRLMTTDAHMNETKTPLDMEVHHLAEDNCGHYWIGNMDGIFCLSNDFTNALFTTSGNGSAGLSTTPGSAIWKDAEENLWFCTAQGIYRAIPQELYTISPLRLTEVWANGTLHSHNYQWNDDRLLFNAEENNLTFRFMSMGYEGSLPMMIEYRLEGHDTAWVREKGKFEATYYNLPPGDYTLKVRKMKNNETMDTLTFTIASKFNGWLIGIIFLLTTLIIGTSYWTIRKKREKRQKETQPTPMMPSSSSGDIQETPSVEPSEERHTNLPDEEVERIIRRLTEYMETEKAYLNVELKQSDLAIILECPTYVLSSIFTYHLKTGYYDYINGYRIEHFKRAIANGEHQKYTLVTLAEKCGFKSKASFYRTFKKFTGMTPNEYIGMEEEGK